MTQDKGGRVAHLHLEQRPVVADGEEERSERAPLRASLGRHEDVAVAVSRLLVEEEEAARDLVPQRHRGDELGVPATQASKDGLS